MCQRPKIAVIVLNWRNAADTLECLSSISRSSQPVDVLVVDNASGDGSADLIENSGHATVVIRHVRNDGYAGGNNVGLREALRRGYEILIVLNNDTLVEVDTFSNLIRACRAAGPLSAVSPRIMYADSPDTPWFAGGVVERGLPRHLQPAEVPTRQGLTRSETLTGCCIAATADVWRRVGLFDERYFLIFEDSDWSARAVKRGIPLFVDQESVVLHKVSRSFAGGAMRLMGTYFYIRNGLRYHARHQPRHLPRFFASRVLRTLLQPRDQGRGRRRFTALATVQAANHRGGNALPWMWTFAERLAGGER